MRGIYYRYTDHQGVEGDGMTAWVPRTLVADWHVGDPGLVRHGADGSAWLGRGTLTFYR